MVSSYGVTPWRARARAHPGPGPPIVHFDHVSGSRAMGAGRRARRVNMCVSVNVLVCRE